MKKVYVSGAISAETLDEIDENIEFARRHMLELWKIPNLGVFCPHTNDMGAHLGGAPYEQLMEFDFWMVKNCDAIYMLPNWEDSLGAKRELAYAQALGKRVLHSITEVKAWVKE